MICSFIKFVDTLRFWLRSDNSNGHLHEDPHASLFEEVNGWGIPRGIPWALTICEIVVNAPGLLLGASGAQSFIEAGHIEVCNVL
jgi:hypothetical protein